MEPHLGEKYESPEQFKLCLTNYAVANGYQLRFAKCDRSRILVRCGKKGDENKCPFRCWESWMGNELTWQVKSLEKKHLSRGQCERARALAFTLIDGKLVDQYARIWDYGNEVLRSNPGSTIETGVDVNPDGKYFKRFYICLKALKVGWLKGCRKVIDLDGCFLKGKVKGELIAAIGRDGNNQIYPIAWAVVNVENKDNWKWFIKLLQSDIETVEGNGVTLISNQHKGLLEAVKEVMPHVEHRQCARHICANFYKHFSGEIYKTLFWEVAMSTTDQQFKNNMEKMKQLNNDAYDDLMKRNPKTWCRAYFATNRACEAVENGISESFNSTIIGARGKPLITMLEEIRLHVMERNWMVIPSGPQLEVRNGYEGYMVDLADCAPPKEKKPPGRPKKPHSDEAPSKQPTTSGGRGGRGPIREREGRGSYVGTSGGRGGRSFITQDDGVPETQFDIENANWEDQSQVVGGIAIDVPIICEKLKPRKPSG
uniref:MULE transposase domain-containing protein n=1 Tax=Lactuca sativa TaxID=4236 RepID=A0A9R1V2H7_LACSA|nr:hypothetical protein LSAT_V11C700369130 [Lactuca sativa]